MRTRLLYAAAGILATLVGMAAGHLVAGLLNPAASPVLAVGSTVIDLTPTPLKEWAIRTFGDKDKVILVGSVVAGTVLLAGVAGLLSRRRFALGAGVLLVLVAAAGTAALLRPAAGPLDLLPALATALAGIGALTVLVRGLRASAAAVGPGGGDAGRRADRATPAGPSRRGVLVSAGVLAAAAAVMGGASYWIARLRTGVTAVDLPAAQDPLGPLPRGLENEYPGISDFRTPIPDFYRVDTRLTLPVIDLEEYTLTIDGDVAEVLTFGFEELLDMDLVERDITLTCVSNEVGGQLVGAARWTGIPLRTLLDRAGVGMDANQIVCTDVDGMTISVPLQMAMDGRDALVAVGMNGASLPREHGFPVRMVVPGLYGFISACKWMTRMTLTTYEEEQAYWTERDWATEAPIKPSSRIDTPKSFEEIDAGETFIGGVAWAQTRGVERVEVQVDGGAWAEAKLGPSAGDDYWVQWYLPWRAESGEHRLACRVVTEDGETQTAARSTPFPRGASGLQSIVVRVA